MPYYTHPVVFTKADTGERPYQRLHPHSTGLDPTDGRGAAQLDFDNDGDMDLAVATMPGEPFKLYENQAPRRNSIQITLDGTDDESTVRGTRVYATIGNETRLHVLNSKTDYLSQDSRTVHLGLGEHPRGHVRVVWPDGTEQEYRLDPGYRYTISRTGIESTVAFKD